jgi:hypothetical protein
MSLVCLFRFPWCALLPLVCGRPFFWGETLFGVEKKKRREKKENRARKVRADFPRSPSLEA